MERKNKKHTAEFKQGAVELAQQLGNLAEAARQLGINDNLIYVWRAQLSGSGTGQKPSPSHPPKSSEQLEIERLRK